jgi:hypothetical protein
VRLASVSHLGFGFLWWLIVGFMAFYTGSIGATRLAGFRTHVEPG